MILDIDPHSVELKERYNQISAYLDLLCSANIKDEETISIILEKFNISINMFENISTYYNMYKSFKIPEINNYGKKWPEQIIAGSYSYLESLFIDLYFNRYDCLLKKNEVTFINLVGIFENKITVFFCDFIN